MEENENRKIRMQTGNKGRFQPGNPGKPKGAEARTTKEAKEIFISIMNGEVDNIKDSFDKIRKKDPAKYLDVLAKLFPYFMPKQMEINATGKIITVNPPDKRTNID